MDVRRCATGEVVVIHDEDTRRVAGERLVVEEAPLAALRELDAGAWKGDRHRGERIPLLAEVLETLPQAVVNVELKGSDRRLAGAVADVLRHTGGADRVVVSSFHLGLLAAFRAAAPGVARGLLFERRPAWRLRLALAARLLRPAAMHPEARLVTAARVRRWRRLGLLVNVWTVDDPAEVERLAGLGASALITNEPGKVVSLLRGLPP
jgi:glycerophosphoryl diester phosphodiesterase